MSKPITFATVCSGIEAVSVGFNAVIGAEFVPLWFSEIAKFPCELLAHHYPNTPNLGDMCALPELIQKQGIKYAPDIIFGGTPCQAFSVAGSRKGLNDERGLLAIKYIEVINAVDDVRERAKLPATIAIWENVQGALFDKTNAFGCFLGAISGEEVELQPTGGKWSNSGCVFGPTRTVAWRVFNAEYFGVAQRRRRVFVVASARKEFCPLKLLFEFDGLRRDIAPMRNTQSDITPDGGGGAELQNKTTISIATKQQSMAMGLNISLPLLASDYKEPQAVCINASQDPIHCVESTPPVTTHGNGLAVTYGLMGNWIGRKPQNGGNATLPPLEVSPCLTRTDIHGIFTIGSNSDIRRLTPIEYERLQGFSDNYTLIPVSGTGRAKNVSEDRLKYLRQYLPELTLESALQLSGDGVRYAALGNSIAVPIVTWLGDRISAMLSQPSHSEVTTMSQ